MKYWLFKSDPESYNWEDMKRDKVTFWDGVRNFQARNFLRDEIKSGDKVFFYHSNSNPSAIMGICSVIKDGYADNTQFNPEDEHFYPSALPEKPIWFMVDIKFEKELSRPVSINEIKSNPKLSAMKLIQKGSRLSVLPVTKEEWEEIIKMSEEKM